MSFSNNELFQKGLPDCRQMVSNLNVDRSLENGSSEFGFPNQQLVTEWCWGNIWSRPGHERKQRSLLNTGMLIALKSWPELGENVRGAINNGLVEQEIREAIRQASIYCGVPAGMEATKVAEATLNDMEQRGEYVRQLAVKAHDA
ncbi:hypothetical protein V2G26_007712 [Clonostachys chloroleuca]